MQPGDVELAAPVADVLRVQVAQRLLALPGDAQPGVEQENGAGAPEAVVELEVLVRDEPFVPTAQVAHELRAVRTEGDVVDLLLGDAVVVERPADAETAAERGRDGPASRRRTHA